VNLLRRIFQAVDGDGRLLLALVAVAVAAWGLCMLVAGMNGHFSAAQAVSLGVSLDELRSIADTRLVNLMIHDRVGCSGAIMGAGILLFWFALRPRSSTGAALQREGASRLAAVQHGRRLLLAVALGVIASGVIIAWVGATTVFLDEDLDYLQLKVADLQHQTALIELMSRDRVGYGAAVFCCGWLMFACAFCGVRLCSQWAALFAAGTCGFASTIGVHFPIGYTQFSHVGPAYLGAAMFYAGMALIWRRDEPGRGG
jgi:hypothetical protein